MWYQVHSDVFNKRITNTATEISGRCHLKNKTLLRSVKDEILVATDGAGNEYHFEKPRSRHCVAINRLIKSNGNQIQYIYDKESILAIIRAVNCAGKPFGQFKFNQKIDEHDRNFVNLEVISSTGKSVSYAMRRVKSKKRKWILESVKRSEAPSQSYRYDSDFKITRKEDPDQRFLETEYYEPASTGDKSLSIGKVKVQRAPVGADATPIPIYRFVYSWKASQEKKLFPDIYSGKTKVYDAYEHQRIYHFTNEERLNKIEYFEGTTEHRLYCQEQFFWGALETSDTGNLMAKVLSAANGEGVLCRTYSYDSQGNAIGMCLYGNLTGTQNTPLIIDPSGKPCSQCECLFTGHEYSTEGRNLVTYENHPAKDHDYLYEYHEGTDLLKARYAIEGTAIRIREFFDYDDSRSLVTKIIDDGSSLDRYNFSDVTERRLTRIHNCNSPLGLPEISEEKYVDLTTRQECLLKKLVNRYDSSGRLWQQSIYDSQGVFSYTLEWKYNLHGKVIKESNACGETIVRRYDANDNKIYERGPRQDVHQEYVYDFMNRLIRQEEVWSDGTRLVKTYKYDYLGNQIASTDIYGNETIYVYDDFSRVKKIIYPAVPDENGNFVNPIIEKEYDILGHEIAMTDAAGAKTTTRYTIRGKPTLIQYPDGTQEQFEYTLKGQLRKSVARNGSYTLFDYDYLARPLKEALYSADGALISCLTRTYNAFHLIQETDAAGYITYFYYDGAGRIIRKEKGNSRTDYSYDSLGRLAETRDYFEEGYIATCYAFDFLDRTLAETVQDAAGHVYRKVAYTYDDAGNRQEVITYNQSGISIETTRYNPHGDPIERIDALGNTTHICYHYPFCNTIETTDPLGRVTFSMRDARDNVLTLEQKNAFGCLIKKSEYSYDSVGNRKNHKETVITPNAPDRQIITSWDYDTMQRVTCLIEAVGTPEQRTTRYAYNTSGRLACKVKPDGKKLIYHYDAADRLQDCASSDDSFHYTYDYDLNGNPVCINDIKSGTPTFKEYDDLERLTKETLGNGLVLSYDYDALGRLTLITLPDLSQIRYTYQGPYLHQVLRFSSTGEIHYTHTYTDYDLAGNPIKTNLIGMAGKAEYCYDLLNRVKHITISGVNGTLFKETVATRDAGGNLVTRACEDGLGLTDCQYIYDDLDQLQSEYGVIQHHFINDSLYNQISQSKIDSLNQLIEGQEDYFEYDLNGNRILKRSTEDKRYDYDAKNRLVAVLFSDQKVEYDYDASNRRLSKKTYSWNGDWQLERTVRYLYHDCKEIGACDEQGRLIELRVLGLTTLGREIGAAIAIELQNEVFAPLHDHLGNVVSLVKAADGSVYETYRYSAFREEQLFGDQELPVKDSLNPWRYASKRKDAETGFVYFGLRYYDPTTNRWLTTDPAGFVDGMNLYAYLHNNPFRYADPDGRFAFVIPFVVVAFGTEITITATTIAAISGTLVGAALGYGTYELLRHVDQKLDSPSVMNTLAEEEKTEQEEKKKGKKRGKDNKIKGGPPRDPDTADYLPDPAAEGSPHTTIGTKQGSSGPYTQGATFDEKGKFRRRTDITDHGRRDHPKPHYHDATGPNSANSPPQAFPDIF